MDSVSDLLEIAGEDDSLLSGVNNSTSANLFSCSPLVSIRSRPPQTAQPVERIETTSVVSEDLNSSPKCSGPEASETQQSQQKKRKKKFGGFNLRKSLAWDRAFFTEQGVLNPTELSMISGTATPNSKSNLEVIDEEELATTSTVLQQIEENLFRHSSGGVSIRAKKIGAVSGLSPKPGASVKRTPPVASLGKRKVLATNNVGNKYKRSAIPKAVPSSSVKRTDTAKTPSKESKITRISGPKSNVSANATTTRSGMLSSSSSKRNQNAHPGLSKNPAPSIPSLSKNPSPSIPRLSKNPTPSIPSLSKNPTPSIPSLSKNPTPSIPRLSKNPTYVPSIPKVDTADKCSVSRTLTKQAGKLLDNSVSVPRPPSSMHQTGTIKSSGLRKPSPSIGFFSQVKASSSHSLQKSSIPCKPSESNIPKLRKLETVSVKEARPKIVKGAAKNTKELSLSDVQSEAIMQIDNKQMAGVEVECDSSSFEIVSKQAEVENILDDVILKSQEQGELHENKIISSKENMALPTHGKEFLPKSQTHEQLEKEADHDLGNKLYDVSSNVDRSLYQEPQSMLNPIMQRTSNTVQNALGQDEGDQIKGPSGDVLTFKESLILQEEHITSFKDGRHSGEFKGDNNVKSALLNSSLDDFSKTVPEGSKHGTPCKNTEQVNYGAGEFGKYGRDAQGHLLNDSLTINCKKTTQSNLEAVSLQLQADQPKTLNPSGVKENGREKENISNMNCSQHVHVMTLFSKGSPEKSILGINGASENESKIIEIKLPVNDQSGFIPRSPMDKECDQVIDSKAVHDRTPEFELDRLNEDCITVSTSSMADDNNINEDSHLPGFQKPSAVVTVNSQDVHLDSDFLPAVIVSPTELKDQNLVEDAFEDCGFHSNEHNATNHHIEDMLVNIDGNDVDRKVELLQINDVDRKVELLHINDVDEKVEFLQINDVDEKVELLQINDMDEKVELLQINDVEDGNHDVDEKVEVLQINGAEDGNRDVYVKVELLQINDVDEKVELLQINDVDEKVKLLQINDVDEKVEFSQIKDVEDGDHDVDEKEGLLQINDVDEKVELLQIIDVDEKVERLQINDMDEKVEFSQVNDIEDGNHDVDENLELMQINDAEDGNHDVDEKGKLLQIYDVEDGDHDVDGKAELLQISDVEDGKHDMDEKAELLQINGAEDGNCDVDENVELLQINDVDEKVKLLQINDVEDGNHDVDQKVELLMEINGAEDGNLDADKKVEFSQIDGVDEKVEVLQIIDVEDGNHDVDEKVELLQINGAEDGNHDVDEKVELLQIKGAEDGIHDVDEKVEFLQINGAEDGNHDVDEKVELLQINGAKDGNHDVDEKVELLQINGAEDGNYDVDEKVELLQINGAEDGNHDGDEKVELLQINGAEEGSLVDISPSFEIQLENVISDEFDSSTKVSEDLCLLSEKSKLLASENSIFNATIPQGSKVSSMKLNENAISAEVDSSIEVSEDSCLLSEESKLLASDNPTFIETIPQGNEVSSANSESFSEEAVTTVFENDKSPNAELDSSIEVSEDSCLLSEKSKLLASDNPAFIETIPQGNEVSSANSESFSDVAVTTVFENDKSPNTDMPSQTEDNIDFLEDNSKKIHLEIDASKTKQEVPIAKPPLNVAPFTEEWFAAIEAAGEAKLLNSDMLVNKDGNQDMDEKVELLGISGAEEGSLDISPSVDIQDMDEKVELLRINGADEGSLDISPSVEVQLENVISDEFDSSTEVSEDPCLLSENSKLLASENSIFNARIPQGSEVSSMRLNENAISAELDSSIEVNEGPCLLSEKSKLLASENSIFNARIPQGSEVSSMKLNENAISAELDSSIEVNEGLCLLSEKSKLLASENSIFNATIPQGSEVSSMILDENAISAELDSSIEVSEGPCLLSEKSKLLASENSIFNATIPQGSGVSSMKLNENAISAELDSYIEVSEGPCLLSENSKLLASEKSIFNATIPQGSKVSSVKLDENAISAELDYSIEVSEGPCLLSEKSKLLALENSIFNATIPQGSEVSSMKLNENAISAELDSSIEVTEGPFTSVVAWKPQEQCLLCQKPKILASDNPTFIETIPQGNEVSSENSESFSDVAVTTVFENDKSPNTDSLSQTNHNRKTIHLEIDATKTKQEVPIVAPPLNVAPFTEEWLAAIEAAGENILTMKSGAVQNSPPDKVQNEPNPWSPVKKNQEIGPFDCTKITKHNLLSSDPS